MRYLSTTHKHNIYTQTQTHTTKWLLFWIMNLLMLNHSPHFSWCTSNMVFFFYSFNSRNCIFCIRMNSTVSLWLYLLGIIKVIRIVKKNKMRNAHDETTTTKTKTMKMTTNAQNCIENEMMRVWRCALIIVKHWARTDKLTHRPDKLVFQIFCVDIYYIERRR